MASAEPGRKAPYSVDLRWRIVWQRIGMDFEFRKIANNLNVSLDTVHNIYKQFSLTGNVAPKQQPSRIGCRSLDHSDELFILGIILDTPSTYLQELCQAVHEVTGKDVSPATICRVIRRNGYTRKKLQYVAKQRSVEYRGFYMSQVQLFRRDQFVFVDETGCKSKDHMRRFGYALRGKSPVQHGILHKGGRISAIAAIASTGVVAVDMTTGSVNGEVFFDFVRTLLIPQMLPFDGENARSIVVLDNCSRHHVQHVIDLFVAAGILVLFLPPYSPDYMPIEETFSYVKYYLKKHVDLWELLDDPKPLIQAAFDSINSQLCNSWISDCGYPL